MAEARDTLERKAREQGALRDRIRPLTFHAGPPGTAANGRPPGRGRVPLTLPQAGKPTQGGDIDAAALARELEGALEGEVRFDAGHRALYSTDGSHYRQVPIGVVTPRTKDDVVKTVEACRRHGAPVLARGGGTSLAGQCCNVAVVLDFSRHMNSVLEVDGERKIARVQPGVVLDDLRKAASAHGLTFGPDPATHNHCTLGGMIGNNSCGIHSVMAQWHTGPRTSDNVHRLEVLTYDGARFWTGPTSDEEYERILQEGGRKAEIYKALRDIRDEHADEIRRRYPDIPRRVSGYNLDDLLPENGFHVARSLVGSECTCALWLEAELHLIPNPKASTLVVVGYPDVYTAADKCPDVMEFKPMGLEAIDERLIRYMKMKGLNEKDVRLLPEGTAFLLVQFGGDDKDEANRNAQAFCDAMEEREDAPVSMRTYDDPDEEQKIWEVRESGLGATAYVPGQPNTYPGWEDSAVEPERLGDYLRELRQLLDDYEYDCAFYGHFGQGLLHTRIDFKLQHHRGVEQYLKFLREAAELVLKYNGSFSGEHGDGQSRGALLSKMFGPRLMKAMRTFKGVWDPDWRMNPGKVVDAYLPDQNLAEGPDWTPPVEETWFQFPADGGSFAAAANRCVGVGKCRRHGGGTMCPSYMVTREEMHSTRGRSRMLYEMMRGEVITDGWRSKEVHEALDLCLGCKGCKGDCPVDVDMATYKAEFYAHYYKGRLRPRNAYAFGWIHWWARLASKAPRLANFLTHAGPLARAAKWAADVHPDRTIPSFATKTFRKRFEEEMAPVNPDGRKVILWADTFKNHFHPEPLDGGGPRPGGPGLPGGGAGAPPLLRATAVRLRLPGDGPEAPPAHRGRAPGRHPRGGARGGGGAELHRHLPGRAHGDAPQRQGGPAAQQADVPPPRVPPPLRRRRGAPRHGVEGPPPRTLPAEGGTGLRRRQAHPRPAGHRRGGPRHRLLRHGGALRLREGPLRGEPGVRQPGAAAGGGGA